MEKLPSDSNSDSLENKLGFANEIDSTNKIIKTEASTSVVTTKSAKSSIVQHKLSRRKKGGSQLRS
ncbi:3810_t:CDS:2 [Racocetra fulgida]|uniref:3810_t:CDS:1 n=1 Tax=Racocetra fulgida TaxID=60492 RepID=A0A9N8ZII8_9GLOM|nr:3810_t:CDS:2 [Racocetra fulgida]